MYLPIFKWCLYHLWRFFFSKKKGKLFDGKSTEKIKEKIKRKITSKITENSRWILLWKLTLWVPICISFFRKLKQTKWPNIRKTFWTMKYRLLIKVKALNRFCDVNLGIFLFQHFLKRTNVFTQKTHQKQFYPLKNFPCIQHWNHESPAKQF